MNQLGYLCRRLLLAVPTFIGITLVCFALTRFLPGGPVEMRLLRMKGGDRQTESGATAAAARRSGHGIRLYAERSTSSR